MKIEKNFQIIGIFNFIDATADKIFFELPLQTGIGAITVRKYTQDHAYWRKFIIER